MHCATRRIALALFLPAVTCAVVRWSIYEVALRGPADVERQMDLAARLLLTFDPFRAATVMERLERFMGGQQPRHATLN